MTRRCCPSQLHSVNILPHLRWSRGVDGIGLPAFASATDDELGQILQGEVDLKELKHKIKEGPAFQRASRSMSQIGG